MKKFTPILLIIAAVLFAVLGVKGIIAQNNYKETTATISSIERIEGATTDADGNTEDSYTVMVKYTVNNKEYESEYGTYTSSMKEGDEITIKYNPSSPETIASSGYTGVIIQLVVAVGCLVGAVVTFLKKRTA